MSLKDKITEHINKSIKYILFLTILCVISLISVLFYHGVYKQKTAETMALMASIQVLFGMTIGYISIYFGLLMTWFGIEASFEVEGNIDRAETKGALALKSSSPGLLFALGGMVLIALSLYKQLDYSESRPSGGLENRPPSRTGDLNAVSRKPPPPLSTKGSGKPN